MAKQQDLDIDLRSQRKHDRLRIDFTMTNRARSAVYVFTRAASPNLQPLPHRAYTAYSDADQSLHLLLAEAPIPKGLSVYVKVVPFARHLRPGESHSDYLEVPLPVSEWQPYADPQQTNDVETVETRRVVLLTEYWWEPATIKLARVEGHLGYVKGFGTPCWQATATLELPEPIAVLKRCDDFARF